MAGIERAEEASTLRLHWDGSPIGVARKEDREIEVPGLSTFGVDQARVVAAPEPHVELRFTDPLKPGQNLKGLVRIGDRDDLRFVIDGSRLEIYGTKGWRGEQTVRVEPGVRNVLGYRMKEARELVVTFEQLKPAVRFAGKGVIVPTSAGFTVPIETVNLRAVTVEALQIASSNMPQFLQVNALDGEQELQRVGRVVWRKTLPLDLTADKENRWLKVGLDVSPLLAKSPGGMYRLTLSFRRPHVAWPCEGQPAEAEPERPAASEDDEQEQSYWDNWAENESGNWDERYENRDNPCHPAYYQRFYDHNIARRAQRARLRPRAHGQGRRGRPRARGRERPADDRARLGRRGDAPRLPAADARQRAHRPRRARAARRRASRVSRHRAAAAGRPATCAWTAARRCRSPTSTWPAPASPKGLKGFLYGERGIWRPGDTMHLTLRAATTRRSGSPPITRCASTSSTRAASWCGA